MGTFKSWHHSEHYKSNIEEEQIKTTIAQVSVASKMVVFVNNIIRVTNAIEVITVCADCFQILIELFHVIVQVTFSLDEDF